MKQPVWLRAGLLVALAVGGSFVACGSEVDVQTDGDSVSSSAGSGSTGATGSTGSSGPTDPMWPKRITIHSSFAVDQSDGVRLADGATVSGAGDLSLYTGKMLSVTSPVPESVCAKGKFDALGDVPTDLDSCPADLSGTWQHFAYLSATTLHTTEESMVAGLGLLLWNEEHTALYRARVVGDSYDAQAMSTVTIDYEPVP
jgi:hypothetical protein